MTTFLLRATALILALSVCVVVALFVAAVAVEIFAHVVLK